MEAEDYMAITNGYTDLNTVKSYLRIPQSDTIDDAAIENAINAASREIDAFTERIFYNAGTATRTFMPDDVYQTSIDDLISISSLKTSSEGISYDTTWNLATDAQLEPLNSISGGITGHPSTRIRAIGNYLFPIYEPRNVNSNQASVQVIGVWGWSAVPDQIAYATALYAMRLWKRQEAVFGIAGFGEIGVMRVSRLDPDVQQLVEPFRKLRMA